MTRRLREAVAGSGTNALVGGFINSNAMIAEVLHIRLAEAGLARADRVRLFSIVTAADGVLIATVGGPDSAAIGQRHLGAARGAARAPGDHGLIDTASSIHEGAMRLKQMGVNRLAVARASSATRSDLDALAIGAECAKPIGAHSNIAKLAALTYGQAMSQNRASSAPSSRLVRILGAVRALERLEAGLVGQPGDLVVQAQQLLTSRRTRRPSRCSTMSTSGRPRGQERRRVMV